MGVDFTNIDGLLKEIYAKIDIENLQNMEDGTLKRIKVSPTRLAGSGVKLPVNVQGNQVGMKSQNELEALGDPGNQVPLQWQINAKVFTDHVRFSGLSLEVAKGAEESFANNMTFQMDEGIKDSVKERNQQFFRDGSGLKAQVNGAQLAGATVIDVDNGIITHFRLGEVIDFVAPGPVLETTATIVAIDIVNSQIVVTPLPANISDNSGIYRHDVWLNAPADGKELAGLPRITDDGTLSAIYQGLDRTTYQALQGITFNAGGVNLSNDLLEQAISRVKITSGRNPTKVVSNTSQFRKYLDNLTPIKRFDSKTKMDSGYEEVPTWNGKEWIVDTDCGFAELYMLSMDYIQMYQTKSLGWDKKGGSILKHTPGFDAGYAVLTAYDNLGCQVPNSHVRIINLSKPLY